MGMVNFDMKIVTFTRDNFVKTSHKDMAKCMIKMAKFWKRDNGLMED